MKSSDQLTVSLGLLCYTLKGLHELKKPEKLLYQTHFTRYLE